MKLEIDDLSVGDILIIDPLISNSRDLYLVLCVERGTNEILLSRLNGDVLRTYPLWYLKINILIKVIN